MTTSVRQKKNLSVIQDVHLFFLSVMGLQALQYYKMGLPCIWMLKDKHPEPQLQDHHLLRKRSPVDKYTVSYCNQSYLSTHPLSLPVLNTVFSLFWGNMAILENGYRKT